MSEEKKEEQKSQSEEKKANKTVTLKENGAAMENVKGADSTKAVVPEKFKDLVKQIEELSVLELSELVKVLEEKFGVSASVPMVSQAAPQTNSSANRKEEEEEKSEFDVELAACGDAKIAVIKIVKEVTGKGLKESKEIVDSAPKIIKEKLPKAEAEDLKKKFEEAGAVVNLK